jgi:arylsulfatase A-like enzyme/Tfp pilus assembly protein PilF
MISRERKSNIFFLLCVLFLISQSSWTGGSARPARWNLLLVTIDTLRADRLSCYGSARLETPVIDSLAARGAIFSRAFAHTPTTLPSHTNILLGLTPLTHGVHDNANFVVPREFLSLAEHLKGFQYATAAIVGAYPLDSRFGLDQGFDLYDDRYGWQDFEKSNYVERPAADVVNRGLEYLRGRSEPWFLWLHCFDPHVPYEAPSPFRERHADSPYDGEVAYVDSALAPLLDYLRENGLFDRTVIVLTADHGESLGQHDENTHGYLAYNPTLWVPLIICVPGLKSVRIESKVSHVDIFPTVCEALGIDRPKGLAGVSLLPALRGKKLSERPIYFESLYPFYSRGWAPLRGFISGDDKFIDSPIAELYNLAADFEESQNRIDQNSLKDLKSRLADLIRRESRGAGKSAAAPADAESLERLRSLGYAGGQQSSLKESFGPGDDIKTMLPFSNRAEAALALYRAGDEPGAVKELEMVLKEKPDVDIAYTILAQIHKEKEELARAIDVLKQGMARLPANYEIYLAFISALQTAGRHDELIQSMAEQKYPQAEHDPEIWNTLGVAYAGVGNMEKAIAAYNKCLSIDRDHLAAWNNLGTAAFILFARTNNRRWFEKAISCFDSALRLEPDSAQAYNGLGAVHRQAGDLNTAISFWEKAVELSPDFGNALYNLGTAYLEKGDRSKSLAYLSRYKTLFYSFLPLEERIKLDDLIQKCRQ